MNVQNYLLCILYIFLIIVHSFTLCEKDFHRSLISIFSFALFTETLSTILLAIHQIVLNYGQQLTEFADVDLSPIYNIHYFAQLIHIISINFFILFLLIVAKGWPITRRDILFKYAFAIFWTLCLAADLITFYWTTLTIIAKNLARHYNTESMISLINNITAQNSNSTINLISNATASDIHLVDESSNSTASTKLTASIIESLPNDSEQFNTTPRRLSLVLRIVIMLYFLLELRTTMILEQEKKKLQFYLQFGALSMVWFVHSVIVYIISLRVEIVWQSKLISGFSSAANFLAFAVTTRLLWPRSSRSQLFRRHKRDRSNSTEEIELENFSTNKDDDNSDDEYDGLEMRVLEGESSKSLSDTRVHEVSGGDRAEITVNFVGIPGIKVDLTRGDADQTKADSDGKPTPEQQHEKAIS